MTAAEFAKMKGRGTATYFGVIGSRPIKNIRTNLPFPERVVEDLKSEIGNERQQHVRNPPTEASKAAVRYVGQTSRAAAWFA